jgi:hypothetical protein
MGSVSTEASMVNGPLKSAYRVGLFSRVLFQTEVVDSKVSILGTRFREYDGYGSPGP